VSRNDDHRQEGVPSCGSSPATSRPPRLPSFRETATFLRGRRPVRSSLPLPRQRPRRAARHPEGNSEERQATSGEAGTNRCRRPIVVRPPTPAESAYPGGGLTTDLRARSGVWLARRSHHSDCENLWSTRLTGHPIWRIVKAGSRWRAGFGRERVRDSVAWCGGCLLLLAHNSCLGE
jgi:hypothetical protein